MSEPDGPECYIPRLEQTMKEIPDKYHNFLWDYTGNGNGPKSVQAAVCYVLILTTEQAQQADTTLLRRFSAASESDEVNGKSVRLMQQQYFACQYTLSDFVE